MIGVPRRPPSSREVPEFPGATCAIARARRVRVPRAVHVQGRARSRGAARSGRSARLEMDKYGIERGMLGTSRRTSRHAAGAASEHPDRFFGGCEVDPNRGMDAVRELEQAVEELGVKAAHGVPGGPEPAGADQRQEVLSALREVRRARHPDLRVRRRARAARAVRAPVRRPDRRGVLVLPRAEVRDAPRLRTVGRPRGEAAAEVAEPLLLDVARSRRSTTRRTSSTSRTRAAPTR